MAARHAPKDAKNVTTTISEGARQTVIAPARNGNAAAPAETGGNSPCRWLKTLNLNTYKAHSHGDYAATIRRYGTTDSYTTEPVRNNMWFSS